MNAEMLGFIDVLRPENGFLHIEGWGAEKKADGYIGVDELEIHIGNSVFHKKIVGRVREDVTAYLKCDEHKFGFIMDVDIQNTSLPRSFEYMYIYIVTYSGKKLLIYGKIDNKDIILSTGAVAGIERDELCVMWSLTDGCNYRCPYCWCRKTFKHFSTLQQLLTGFDTLLALNRPRYQITLYGGEPTYHPDCLELIDYIVRNNTDDRIDLRLITNGSRDAKYFQKLCAIVPEGRFKIIFSLHQLETDIKNFINNIKICASHGIQIGINFVLPAGMLQKAREYADALADVLQNPEIKLNVDIVFDERGNRQSKLSDEEILFIREFREAYPQNKAEFKKDSPFFSNSKTTIKIIHAGEFIEIPYILNDSSPTIFTGYYCSQGTNVVYITEDGDIMGSICADAVRIGNAFSDTPPANSHLNVYKKMYSTFLPLF